MTQTTNQIFKKGQLYKGKPSLDYALSTPGSEHTINPVIKRDNGQSPFFSGVFSSSNVVQLQTSSNICFINTPWSIEKTGDWKT